jgi:hypothetical protein
MLNNDEARTAYGELLEKLRAAGAQEIVTQIERVVGEGRTQQRKSDFIQEPLPAISELTVAIRMLACWIEPLFLVPQARSLLREVTRNEVGSIYWAMDRRDSIEAGQGSLFAERPPLPGLTESSHGLPQVDTRELDPVREQLDHLYQILAELESTEGS